MKNKMFLVVIDAYSRWIDMLPVSSATSETIIEKLKTLMVFLVTDNATVFLSEEMTKFWQNNDIRHITSLLYCITWLQMA